jgi:hypothetical protein
MPCFLREQQSTAEGHVTQSCTATSARKAKGFVFCNCNVLPTLGNEDSQQKVIKGHAPNGDLETSLCGVEHKGVGCTGLSFSAQASLHQMFSPGCILAWVNPVWDALIFLCQTTPSPKALKGEKRFKP